jgi:hypothetical protein
MTISQDAVARRDGGRFSVSRQEPAISSALVTALTCASIAVCGWIPFGFAGASIRGLLSPAGCTAFEGRTAAMYLCSAKVALLTLTGPIGLGILFVGCFVIFRKWTTQKLAACARKIPNRFRYIVAPVIATFMFTIIWSGSHYGMALGFGLPSGKTPARCCLSVSVHGSW